MAKTASVSEQAMPTTGRWIWKDETNTLEFLSNNPNADKHDRRKDRRQKGIHFQDMKRSERGATPNIGSRAYGIGRGRGQVGQRSPKPSQKQAQEHTHVTLADVKNVAIGMLSEVEGIPPAFGDLFNTQQFDEFLMFLLYYFECFYKKRAQEMKPNPMNIEPSLKEIQHYEELCAKLEVAQKQLGQAYGVMVLGLGMEHTHHMHCGMSRVSNTYQDRSMYETLYSFCTFMVWICFKRKEYEIVKKEIGRMLRSDTFNPALRIKQGVEDEKTDKKKDSDTESKNVQESSEGSDKKGDEDHKEDRENKAQKDKSEQKRPKSSLIHAQGKRPAIKSIINQRSPALVSILPSPKEEAHWLFKRTRPLSPNSLGSVGRENTETEFVVEGHFSRDSLKMHVGIIGEPMEKFNPQTLSPKADNDEDESEGDDKKSEGRRGSQAVSTPHGKGVQSLGLGESENRQATGVSQVTTEAPSDEDD